MKQIPYKRLKEVVRDLMGAEISDYTSCRADEKKIIRRGIRVLRKLLREAEA